MLTQKLLKQGYRYHKLCRTFSKFYRRYYDLISKFQVGLKSLLRQGLSEPDFYGDLVYKLKKIVGSNNISAQFIKIISHYKKIGYNINVLQQTACLVVNPITVGNHISRFQSGFRSDRSTTDNLVRLETFIRDAFIKKEHVVAVFFDLEKAYDTTWRYGILKDIHKLGLRGRLPTFIENFLADRAMQVRVGSSLSDYYDQEQGVPQGGVLSTTLFSIKINDIVKCLGNLTDCSLYVDDFCICYRSKSMATIERQLQQNLNKIENWATSNGFKFSKSKTQCVHFCQLRKQHDDPVLHLYGSPIPVVEESKFLGILFDRKLSFIPHIKYLKAKCLKALNLLKVLSHTSWGADRTTLLKLYRSLVRSKLDYGCIIYGSARKSYLQMLDPIHNQGLRLA